MPPGFFWHCTWHTTSILIPQELSRLLLALPMTIPVSRTFEHYLNSTATLCHSTYLSQLITNHEHQFERFQLPIQKHALSLINVWKLNLMEPPTRSFGQQKMQHYCFHPYGHTVLPLPLAPHPSVTTSAHLFITGPCDHGHYMMFPLMKKLEVEKRHNHGIWQWGIWNTTKPSLCNW
jgi:hypothetical protein